MKFFLNFLLAAILLVSVSARTWTNSAGKTIEADFVRLEGEDKVVIRKGSKEFTLSIADLSPADQEWLENPPPPPPPRLLGKVLKRGKNVIPMDMSDHLDLFKEENREHVRTSAIHLYLPEGFNPEKQYNVMFITATAGGKASDTGTVRPYGVRAIKQGWVVMAVDGKSGRPPVVVTKEKLYLIDAVFDHMNEAWPASRTWKIAGGGSSGGAKSAQMVLMYLGSETYGDHDIAGLLISGCNQALTTAIAEKKDRADKSKRNRVGVYFLQGLEDKVATPSAGKRVLERLKSDGLTTQKWVEYPGGHSRPPELLDDGIKWLTEHIAALDKE